MSLLRRLRRARRFLAAVPWEHRLSQIGQALLVLALFFCPLALGGARLWAVAVAFVLACASLAALALSRHLEQRRLVLPLFALPLAAAAIACALQLCPLPPGLIALAAPATHALFTSSLEPLGLYPAWRPLSLDPPATARALVTLLCCLSAFVAAAQIATSSRGRALLNATIGLSALTVALIGFGHALAHARALFGAFSYAQASPPFLSTFGNPNHLAAFLTLGALSLSSRALNATETGRRFGWWLAYLAVAVAIFLSLSRGGIIAFVIGQALLLWNHRVLDADARHDSGGHRRLLAFLGLGTALACALYIAAQKLIGEWATLTSLDGLTHAKLPLLTATLPLIQAHWRFGVGKGAFEPAFASFIPTSTSGARTFTHPENLPLQWMADLGVVPAALLLIGVAFAFWRGCRSAHRDCLRWGALIAVLTAAIHDLADFSLEFLGTALPATALFALGTAHRHNRRQMAATLALALTAITFALGLTSLSFARHDLRSDSAALLAAPQIDRARLRQVIARHPADEFPRRVAAAHALNATRPAEALAWSGQAMRLFPALASPHALAARALERMGAFAQAATEWTLALERGDQRAAAALAELFARDRLPASDLVRLAPADPALALFLAQRLAERRRDSDANALLDHLDHANETTDANALDRLRLRARLAERRSDSDALLELGPKITALEGPDSHTGLLFEVSALRLRGDIDAARRRLSDQLTRLPTAAVALRLAELELSQGQSAAAREALRQIPATMTIDERVRALTLESAAFRRDGAHAKALTPLRTAVNLKPKDVNLRLKFVEALERAGRLEEALRELVVCRDKSPRGPNREQIELIEQRILQKHDQRTHAARKKSLGID